MAADPRPPTAIRITRPYESEDEYLEHELDMLSRTGITLVGAQPRPEGAVLRFELVLTSGQVLLRGEGRVTGFKPNALQGVGGLSLRFTRLETRSKALIDKAAALRDRRRPSLRPPASSDLPPASVSPPPPRATSLAAPPRTTTPPPPRMATPPPPSVAPAYVSALSIAAPIPPATATGPRPFAPPGAPASSRSFSPLPPREPAEASGARPPESGERPPSDRDALLERLRARAKALDPATVRRLLATRS